MHWTDQTIESSLAIPSTWYFDGAFADWETEHVFAPSWQIAARTDQLMKPGNFVTTTIGGEPVLVIRGKDGQLRAMSNICRHRAATLETRETGTATRLRCNYHGWAYNLNGTLAGAPDCEGNEVIRGGICLPQFKVAEFGPLVFVKLTDLPFPNLEDLFAPFQERGTAARLSGVHFAERKVYDLNCNWKVFIDNYADGGYHIPTVHQELAKVVNMADYETICFDYSHLQLSPLRSSSDDVSSVRSGGPAHYWYVFPNIMINAYEDTADINWVIPTGPESCRVFFDFYFGKGTTQEFIDQSVTVADRVQAEDVGIANQVQSNIRSRNFDRGPYSPRREQGTFQFHSILKDLYNRQFD